MRTRFLFIHYALLQDKSNAYIQQNHTIMKSKTSEAIHVTIIVSEAKVSIQERPSYKIWTIFHRGIWYDTVNMRKGFRSIMTSIYWLKIMFIVLVNRRNPWSTISCLKLITHYWSNRVCVPFQIVCTCLLVLLFLGFILFMENWAKVS